MLENKMVIDSLWPQDREPQVVGECAGCHEDIEKGEDVLEFMGFDGEDVLVHQDSECCYQFVSGMARCVTAGD